MLNINSWKVVDKMTKQYNHSCKEYGVEIFSMSKKKSIIIKFNMEEKI
jgi:hypothetical protein